MSGTMTDTRLIPKSGLTELITSVMKGRSHLAEEPYVTRGEHGWISPRELPPDRGIRLDDFERVITGLPDPCPEPQAAEAVCQVIRDRGHRHLLGELDDQWESRWPAPEETVPEAVPDSASFVLKCGWCGNPIPLARGKMARWCSNSHRVMASRAKKRRERVSAGASPGR